MAIRITDPEMIARLEKMAKNASPSRDRIETRGKVATQSRSLNGGATEHGQCTLWLELGVKGKARARTFQNSEGKTKTRHLPEYRQWMARAREQIEVQWFGRSPLERVEVSVTFWGGSTRNDGDNGVGSVLDALVKSRVLIDDNLSRVPVGHWRFEPAETPRIQIDLTW